MKSQNCRLTRAVASGPVGPVFTGPLFSEHALHARGSLAEPRLLGKAWLREATRRVLIAPRHGAHFGKLKKCLRRPEIRNFLGGACPQTHLGSALTHKSSKQT